MKTNIKELLTMTHNGFRLYPYQGRFVCPPELATKSEIMKMKKTPIGDIVAYRKVAVNANRWKGERDTNGLPVAPLYLYE